MKKLIILAAAMPIIFLSSCREKIDAGSVGLLINQYGTGKGQGVEIVAGATWYNPFTEDVVEIPAFVQHKEFEQFNVNAQDGSVFAMSPQVNYRIEKGKVSDTYRKYRKTLPELEDGVIKTIVKETYRVVCNGYTTDSLMMSRGKFEMQVEMLLKTKLETEGFILEQITSGLTPPSSITSAIDAKNKAVQDAMRIENEVKSTQAEGLKKVAAAKANYDASILNAKAEAEANKLRQQTLTPMLIQQQFIEKWDGKLPQYGTVPSIMKQIQ